MERLSNAYERLASNPENGECMYLLGFTVMLFRDTMITTMFPFSENVSHICLIILLTLICGKILLFDNYSLKMLIAVIMMLACGVLVALSSGYIYPFQWLLLIIGAKDVSFEKIVRLYLIVNISIVSLAFCASMLGIIENLVYIENKTGALRNSFGCIYTTDFAAHIFYMILAVFYIKRNVIHWWYYICTVLAAGLVYYFCRAKLDTVCILLTAFVFGIYNLYKYQYDKEKCRYRFRWQKKYKIFIKRYIKKSVIIVPVLAAFTYMLSYMYVPDNEFMAAVNDISTGRVSLGNIGIKKYGMTFFGQDVPMTGFGGTTKPPKKYFIIDCSYIHVYLKYGLVMTFMLFIIYFVICKKRADVELMLMVIIMAVSCTVDHHLLDIAYNFVPLALFAAVESKAAGKRVLIEKITC